MAPLLRGLHRAAAYSHPVSDVRLVETHISWVLLTGQYAYKIKKPVKLHFLDYSTLQQRLEFCREELRLNRRFAPELYLDVVPITGSVQDPKMGGSGDAVEYAVRMREFPQSSQLDRLLAAGQLHPEDLETFGRRLAQFHSSAPRAGADVEFGEPERVHRPVRENLEDLLAGAQASTEREALTELLQWSNARHAALASTLAQRKRLGWIREGHGDLHLANLVKLDGDVLPFDCIEFSAALRWIDVISDAAFLVMDLKYRQSSALEYRFLNAYLEATGDYEGVRVLRYYLVYRTLVRAKVAMIRRDGAASAERPHHESDVRAHVALARSWTKAAHPTLVLMHGLSGSGKTRVSGMLIPLLPAIRIRSDVERKRLHGLAANTRSGSGLDAGIYDASTTERTYDRLAVLAEAVLSGGETAIVDAAFLRKSQRERFRALAQRLHVPLVIVDCRASLPELERRVDVRVRSGHDPSEADRKVLEYQRQNIEPLDADERALALTADTMHPPEPEALIRALLDLTSRVSS